MDKLIPFTEGFPKHSKPSLARDIKTGGTLRINTFKWNGGNIGQAAPFPYSNKRSTVQRLIATRVEGKKIIRPILNNNQSAVKYDFF
jgi:hypothetical protein